MKFKFLGTAAAEGIPGLFCDCEICEQTRQLRGKNIRTRSQSLLNDDLLIDFPPDTYMHVINNGLDLHKINNCIITHTHSDHFYPDDFLMRAPGFANLKDNKPFNVYGSRVAVDMIMSQPSLKNMIENQGCFNVYEVKPFEPFTVAGYGVTPLPADHGAESSLIYFIEKDGKTVFYAHDTGIFPEDTWKWFEANRPHIDFATFDCCYGLKVCLENHMGFDAVVSVIDRLKEIGAVDGESLLCVNHFSHNSGPLYEDMQKASSESGIITSYDGLEIEF